MRLSAAGVLILLLASEGCATLYSSGPVPVLFQSDGRAEVLVDGRSRGHTPLALALDNEKAVTVTFRQVGLEDITVRIGTRARWGWLLLDLPGLYLFGIPPAIDLITGEYKTLDARVVHVRRANPLPPPSRERR